MQITVATLYTPEMADLGRWTSDNKEIYCCRYGYRFVCQTSTLEPLRPPAWSKLLVVGRELTGADWVCWMDADALVTNPDVKLESLIDNDADLVIACDDNGINTGVFLLRSCPASRHMLDVAWAQTQFIHHAWWEQAAVGFVLSQKMSKVRARYVSKQKLNSYDYDWQPGDFILHAAGQGEGTKSERLQRLVGTRA